MFAGEEPADVGNVHLARWGVCDRDALMKRPFEVPWRFPESFPRHSVRTGENLCSLVISPSLMGLLHWPLPRSSQRALGRRRLGRPRRSIPQPGVTRPGARWREFTDALSAVPISAGAV